MLPEFDQYQEGYGAGLLCPSCGAANLHHERVEIFERGEDQIYGVHVSVTEGRAEFDTNIKENPSARRQGMSIHFSCEHCPAKPVIHISQHKGTTYVDFVK